MSSEDLTERNPWRYFWRATLAMVLQVVLVSSVSFFDLNVVETPVHGVYLVILAVLLSGASLFIFSMGGLCRGALINDLWLEREDLLINGCEKKISCLKCGVRGSYRIVDDDEDQESVVLNTELETDDEED